MNHRPDSYPCESGATPSPWLIRDDRLDRREPGADWLVTVRPMKPSAAQQDSRLVPRLLLSGVLDDAGHFLQEALLISFSTHPEDPALRSC